ncbi:hypothetical protein PM082_016251 [Marasmius tenuissimus]|nr:hypothetical protein PM082_016251 [Marasmius tenuissimus]
MFSVLPSYGRMASCWPEEQSEWIEKVIGRRANLERAKMTTKCILMIISDYHVGQRPFLANPTRPEPEPWLFNLSVGHLLGTEQAQIERQTKNNVQHYNSKNCLSS